MLGIARMRERMTEHRVLEAASMELGGKRQESRFPAGKLEHRRTCHVQSLPHRVRTLLKFGAIEHVRDAHESGRPPIVIGPTLGRQIDEIAGWILRVGVASRIRCKYGEAALQLGVGRSRFGMSPQKVPE